LAGVTDPEAKRKAIGNAFIEVFDAESNLEDVTWLAQGNLSRCDRIGFCKGPSATIKSHNVGGLPDYMKLKIVEPLRMLFQRRSTKSGCLSWH
jgi:GMP synthase (glutamine-hydrolysing)